MDRNNDIGMLDLMARPAFCVSDGRITRVNTQAAACGIETGTALNGLLETGAEEYEAFTGGCLYLTLAVGNRQLGASVTRLENFDVFCLEEIEDNRELQAMALAAREMRAPLETAMLTMQQLFPMVQLQDNPAAREQAAQLNRGLFRMLRVIGNMSDAVQPPTSPRMETVDIPAILDEIFEKAAALVEHTRMKLVYQGWPRQVFGLADQERLERAVLNMISNAIKFSAPGGTIRASLTQRGNKFYLTMEDSGCGIPDGIRGDVFTRYRRSCGLEDQRFGIGLGMVLVRAAAAAHGGTVLIDGDRENGTRITMTIAIRQGSAQFRGRVLKVDYTGCMDPYLIELSEKLPLSLYEQEL